MKKPIVTGRRTNNLNVGSYTPSFRSTYVPPPKGTPNIIVAEYANVEARVLNYLLSGIMSRPDFKWPNSE